MHPSLCDGLPVNYPPSDSTGNNPQPTCTTQSSDSPGDYCNLEDFYTPSPTLQVAETSQPLLQQFCFPPGIDTATQTYPLPQIQSAASSQAIWPTPPATACDDLEDYTYNNSPTNASYGVPAVAYSAGLSAISPGSWPSPEAQQLTFQQASWKSQKPLPPCDMPVCRTISPEDSFHQQMVARPYMTSPFLRNNVVEPESIVASEAPGMTPDQADSAMSDRSPSPVPKNEFGAGCSLGDEETRVNPGRADAGSDRDEANKLDEPYAKLIFRAFMSRERHAMTLQEIYQWFRENTDKAKTENKGWQNSIRHNLSMNAAFVKRDRKPAVGDPVTDAGEPKKSTEWVLEEWAVQDGVQSTTRYRKGNPSRRGASGSHSRSHHARHLSTRASSGRKGGITASRTKAAANHRALRRQQYGEMMTSHLSSTSYHHNHSFYGRHPDMDYASSARGEPVTPPDISAGEILFADPMHGPQALGVNTGQGYYYGIGHPHYRHLHQPQQHPHSGPNAYRLEDVTRVYEPPPVSQTSGPVDPGRLSSHLPPGFNNLFTDDIGDNASEASVHVANLNYNWGDGSQFHS
ncbi:hypothetical protein BJ170DRAFT_684609 [Xylariales sp. AK1849]|nr:hypothetical protein BJ170DRAFT_684609 [Xylariales sp. AK1849]